MNDTTATAWEQGACPHEQVKRWYELNDEQVIILKIQLFR
jgi:hypothetical protein